MYAAAQPQHHFPSRLLAASAEHGPSLRLSPSGRSLCRPWLPVWTGSLTPNKTFWPFGSEASSHPDMRAKVGRGRVERAGRPRPNGAGRGSEGSRRMSDSQVEESREQPRYKSTDRQTHHTRSILISSHSAQTFNTNPALRPTFTSNTNPWLLYHVEPGHSRISIDSHVRPLPRLQRPSGFSEGVPFGKGCCTSKL